MKLKFFNHSWYKKKVVLDVSASQLEALSVPIVNDREANDIKVEKTEPVYSTEQDRESFNSWFYKKKDQPKKNQKETLRKYKLHPLVQSAKFNEASSADSCDIKISSELQNKQDYKLKQEELDMVTNLCCIQANTLAMVVTVQLFMEKIDMIIHLSSTPATIPGQLHRNVLPLHIETPSPYSNLHPSTDISPPAAGILSLCSTLMETGPKESESRVKPWKQGGIIYTKLF